MGIFDKLGGGSKVQLNPKSALALAVMTVIGADGAIDDSELDGLRRVVRGDDDAFNKAYRAYKEKNIRESISLACTTFTTEKQKVATLANLLDVAMADGVLAGAEKEVLELYVQQLGIRDEIVNDLVEVIAMKNDFSVFE